MCSLGLGQCVCIDSEASATAVSSQQLLQDAKGQRPEAAHGHHPLIKCNETVWCVCCDGCTSYPDGKCSSEDKDDSAAILRQSLATVDGLSLPQTIPVRPSVRCRAVRCGAVPCHAVPCFVPSTAAALCHGTSVVAYGRSAVPHSRSAAPCPRYDAATRNDNPSRLSTANHHKCHPFNHKCGRKILVSECPSEAR